VFILAGGPDGLLSDGSIAFIAPLAGAVCKGREFAYSPVIGLSKLMMPLAGVQRIKARPEESVELVLASV